MGSGTDSLPEGLESALRRQVNAAIEAKVAEYRKIIRAFLIGLGLIVTFLVGNRLLSTESLLVLVHDQVFGVDKRLTERMGKNVNFSYSNQFWLEPRREEVQYIPFWADKAQAAKALIEIKHVGAGQRNVVSIHLDDGDLWTGDKDLNFAVEDLTKRIQEPAHFLTGENVHMLTFRLDGAAKNPNDRVLIRVLTNVFGLEE